MWVIFCGFVDNVTNCVVKSVWNILQVEYMLVEMDDKNEKVCLVLNGKDVLEILQEKGEKINPKWVTILVGFIAYRKKIDWNV